MLFVPERGRHLARSASPLQHTWNLFTSLGPATRSERVTASAPSDGLTQLYSHAIFRFIHQATHCENQL